MALLATHPQSFGDRQAWAASREGAVSDAIFHGLSAQFQTAPASLSNQFCHTLGSKINLGQASFFQQAQPPDDGSHIRA